jgi:hypothetical protein
VIPENLQKSSNGTKTTANLGARIFKGTSEVFSFSSFGEEREDYFVGRFPGVGADAPTSG